MNKIRVGVLRGGPSSEYDVSLLSGGAVLKNLNPEKYHPYDILISKEGDWHLHGEVRKPHDIFKHLDVVVNALHGNYGEDGTVQYLLETFGMPYTGSKSLASAVGMNKVLAKKVFKSHGIKTPHFIEIKSDDGSLEELTALVFKKFSLPCVIKPVGSGSSVGVSIVNSFQDIEPALALAFKYDDSILVEEYISGTEATCGVIDTFRGSEHYSLLPVEIRPTTGKFFDYDAKYNGASEEICPASFTPDETAEIQRIAQKAHSALGLRHYSRSDFIVSPKRGIYMLEVNTLPGITEASLLPKSLRAVGSNIAEFLEHLIHLALHKK